MFIPKNTKFSKFQKKKIKNHSSKSLVLAYGTYGLKVKQNCVLNSTHLEMLKFNLSKGTKKTGRFWLRAFSHFSCTSKPLEVRMGKGKGYVDTWISKIKQGAIICELAGLSEKKANILLKKISLKLPVCTSFISKELSNF